MSSTAPHAGEPIEPQFHFLVSGTRLLVPAACVEAVAPFQQPLPLPRVPKHILGLVTFDQRALVLVDLAQFLQLPHDDDGPTPTRILVVRVGDYRVGFPIERAAGIVHLNEDAVRRPTGVFVGRVTEFLHAEAETERGLGGLLDLGPLLEAARA